MQKITLTGRLGRDAAVRETQDGGKMISFTMAVNGISRGVEKTYWYDVLSFNYSRYKNMVKGICRQMNFTSLNYNRLDDMLDAVGIDRDKLCTYCWDGRE